MREIRCENVGGCESRCERVDGYECGCVEQCECGAGVREWVGCERVGRV